MWLAQEENIQELGDTLNLSFTDIETEKVVGSYRCDILAKDELSGKVVLIENQLEPTDHWYEVAVGTSQGHISIDLVNKEHRVRVGFWITDNKELFDDLYEKKEEIERDFDGELVWHRLDNKKASLLCTYINGLDFKKQDNYPELMQMIIETVVKLRTVIKGYL